MTAVEPASRAKDRRRRAAPASMVVTPVSTLADVLAGPVRALVVGVSCDPNAKVTVLLFNEGASAPSMVAKVPTTSLAERAVKHELSILEGLRRLPDHPVLATVPRLIEVVEHEGRLALLVEGFPGVPMAIEYHRWRHTARRESVECDFDAAGAWLAGFQHASTAGVAPLDMDGGVISRIEQRFASEPDIDDLVTRLETICAHLRRANVAQAAVHGDFWCGNLLMRHGRIAGVVDWEAAAMSGAPLRDPLRFALSYALYLDRHTRRGRRVAGHRSLRAGRWGAGIAYAIDGEGWFPDLVRGFIAESMRRVGAPPEAWREAALAAIAEVAAGADHPEFASNHLRLFRELSTPAASAGRRRGSHS